MLKDITTTCPCCGQQTVLAVAVPIPGTEFRQLSQTYCRRCNAGFLSTTHSDGTIVLQLSKAADGSTPHAVPVVATLRSVFGIAEIVRIPFALWQPRGEQIEDFALRAEWANALRDALVAAQREPRPLSVPRRIFISYRGQDSARDAWVETLCRELEARGNLVVFDRRSLLEKRPPSIPELVARIAGCHQFLAVLDPAYLERIAPSESTDSAEGWVTDEFHTAVAFAKQGILSLLGLLREGDTLPAAFRPFAPGSPGNTFDVREPNARVAVLDRFFVQFGVAPLQDTAASAALALHESQRAFDAGDARWALEQADRTCQLVPELADGYAQRARLGYRSGAAKEAFRDARRAFEIDPTLDEMLIYASASACDLREWKTAAGYARTVVERDRAQRNAHYLLGQALTNLEQVYAALAHFNIARSLGFSFATLYSAAGWASRRAGDPVTALAWYQQGLDAFVGDMHLLANATVAAMESGEPATAWKYLELLTRLHPDFSDIEFLAKTLAQWCSEDDSRGPPILTARVTCAGASHVVSCTQCEAQVPFSIATEWLCFGCGAVVPKSAASCNCCGSTGKVFQVPDTQSFCPYCRRGDLMVGTSASSGQT